MTDNPFLPSDADAAIEADPMKAHLHETAVDALEVMGKLVEMPGSPYSEGALAALKRCMARSLRHAYGAHYGEALGVVTDALREAAEGDQRVRIYDSVEPMADAAVAAMLRMR